MVQHWKAIFTKVILLSALTAMISACGFHLRGAQEVSEDKRQVTLITGNADQQLIRGLRRDMKFNGITEASDAPYQLQIVNQRYHRRAATISRNSDVDEYEISLTVTMLVADNQGKPLTSDIRIQRERIYSYDKNAAAASSEQEALLKRELYNSVVQSMLRRYLATNKAP